MDKKIKTEKLALTVLITIGVGGMIGDEGILRYGSGYWHHGKYKNENLII